MNSHINDLQRISVSEFYRRKSVFVTGGTGFLGKVLIEKLLYSCSGIEKIFILMRDKNGTRAIDRLEKILSSPVFSRIRNERPQCLQKIQLVPGDLTSYNMGLTSEQLNIIKKVSVVFHLAATIKFNEPLKNAVTVNVKGTREVIRVLKKVNNLEGFIYISTAFSNSNRTVIDEIVYPPPRSLEAVYDYIESGVENKNNIQNFLDGRPNTYTFTKALAENVVAKQCKEIPVAIIRPSIVTPAVNEPFRGWIDNWLGITTFLFAIAKGWTRLLYGRKETVIDLIPVDYVVNLIIVAATRCKRSEIAPVYNICSSTSNPIDFSLLENLYLKQSAERGFNDFPLVGIIYTTSPMLLKLLSLLLETIPAYIADFWTKITGKRNSFVHGLTFTVGKLRNLSKLPLHNIITSFSYVKAQAKQAIIRETMHFFASHSWVIKSNRSREMFSSLSRQDQLLFPCDPVNFKWSNYIPTYFHGMKTFLLDSREVTGA